MTMALAAHAADGGATAGTGNNNGDDRDDGKEHPHGNGDYHQPCQPSTPTAVAAAAAAGINRDFYRASQDLTAINRRGIPPPSRNRGGGGGGGGGSGRSFSSAAATTAAAACRKMAPITAGAEAGSTSGVGAQGMETAEYEPPTVSGTAEEEKKAANIRAQMSVLMVGFFEIIRQVRCACCTFPTAVERCFLCPLAKSLHL